VLADCCTRRRQILQELPGCDENRCHTKMIMQELEIKFIISKEVMSVKIYGSKG